MSSSVSSRLLKSLKSFASRYRHNSHAVLGLGIFLFTLLVSIFASQIATFDPEKVDIPRRLLPPDTTYLLGTDKLGRDIFSRMVWGTRVSMLIGFIASGLATLIGITIGVVAGYFGGRTDWLLMRFVDMILSIPTFFLVLLASSLFGSNASRGKLIDSEPKCRVEEPVLFNLVTPFCDMLCFANIISPPREMISAIMFDTSVIFPFS